MDGSYRELTADYGIHDLRRVPDATSCAIPVDADSVLVSPPKYTVLLVPLRTALTA